jgi:hypothetical protein
VKTIIQCVSFTKHFSLPTGYLLTLQFLWTYMSQVEKLHIDEPEKFLAMTLFGAAGLLLGKKIKLILKVF